MSVLVAQDETEEVFSARLATSSRVLEALVARQLEKATITSPIVIQLPDDLAGASDEATRTSGHPYENKIAFQVWSVDPNSRMLARSSSAPTERLAAFSPGFQEVRHGEDSWKVFVLPSGAVWIFAAEKLETQREMVEQISFSIITPLLVGAIALLIVTNVIALRSIRPVSVLAQNIANRRPAALTPIAISDAPTELMPVIDELNKLLKEIEQAFSREQRLIDSAAHELRTPVSAMHLHLQNALKARDTGELKECLETALEASTRVVRLAEQLLVFSRVSASAGMEESAMLDLGLVCQGVAAQIQPVVDQYQQTIQVVIEHALLVRGERDKLERLVRNLLDNAALYGSRPGVIRLLVREQGGFAQVVVENDGKAIPDLEKKRIFIPYYRLASHSSFGSGLGLPIALEIATQMSGTISVEDRTSGQGARFIVSLPRV